MKLSVVVEGDGEVFAVPPLIYKILHENGVYDVHVSAPKNAHGCGNLTKSSGIEKFVRYSWLDRDCDGVLVIIDGDTLQGCPLEAAKVLAERVRALNGPKPVAIVVANKEFESWFLASIESIRGQPIDAEVVFPSEASFDGDCESLVSVKGWISRQLPAGKTYKETVHQVSMSRLIDPVLARSKSRSFRRLCSAVIKLIESSRCGSADVSP